MSALELAHAQRTLKVAYTPFNVPIVFAEGATAENYRKLDPKADLARGAFIDLLKAVAGGAGLSMELVPLVAGDHGAALLKGDIDILTAGARTPELDAAAVFSGPTYTYAEGLVVKNGDSRPYRTYEDLRGEVVGAQRGTPSAVALQKIGIFAALNGSRDIRPLRHRGRAREIDDGRYLVVMDNPASAQGLGHSALFCCTAVEVRSWHRVGKSEWLLLRQVPEALADMRTRRCREARTRTETTRL